MAKAARRFRKLTGLGCDFFRPQWFSWLSDELLDQYARLLMVFMFFTVHAFRRAEQSREDRTESTPRVVIRRKGGKGSGGRGRGSLVPLFIYVLGV